ncbi:MAG: ECF transporter S component [Ruminococcaceae bacterium]|nr:ECF transporter S component [Oscillospiraceae bacterium]
MQSTQANKTKRIVLASMLASLICVATMIIKIPTPLKGYLNFGDGVVLLAGWILPPLYGFLAAGIGATLADIFSGYVIYAPATFVIKGLMAPIAFYGFKFLNKKIGNTASRVVSGILAELFMVAGYYLFEGTALYGFEPSLVNIPANAIQGVAGVILGVAFIKIFNKNKIYFKE